MHRTARGFVAPPPITRLRLEREEGTKASSNEDGIGFTLSEMTNMAERALRDIGLTSNFAPLVVIQGHGSDCLNNPHESAYHCGACSGGRGGPNARAMAAMLNDSRVRRQLLARGLDVPEETRFVGAMHNTATDAVKFYDLELLPASHMRHLHYAVDVFGRVAERNAHERCRRFETALLDFSPAEALQHVDDRSEDLAQTRPEYGNSNQRSLFRRQTQSYPWNVSGSPIFPDVLRRQSGHRDVNDSGSNSGRCDSGLRRNQHVVHVVID